MKQIKLLVSNLMNTVIKGANGNNVLASQLPMTIKSFVTNQFKGKSIVFVEKNNGSQQFLYEVSLNDGAQINFNDKGEWTKITNEMGSIPTSMYPSTINHFVYSCFPEATIVMVTKRTFGYMIGLSNAITVKFNNDGLIYGLNS